MEYDFRNDWLYLRMNHEIPQEIVDFMVQSFEILEIRQRVGEVKSIRFEVRSREGNHALPHVHASYDKYSISIAIDSLKVLAGNLPKKQETIAIQWVKNNKDYLLGAWRDYALSATSITTKSRLD